ncbi:hypothetical protein, partial [Bacillus sp. MMSF_3328]|uniref:hypothetical protein n=1 Tax=Bacillus sp. MMSF_3328 TaxID=3047080 RepID=UPI00273E04D0
MAEKKTQSSAKSASSKASGQAQGQGQLPEEILAKLPESEKKAVAELEAFANGGTGKIYRLKDPDTQYVDLETGWSLAGEQAKPLPEAYGAETFARIKDGFLVEADAENPGIVLSGPVVAAGTEEAKARAQEQAKAQTQTDGVVRTSNEPRDTIGSQADADKARAKQSGKTSETSS